jgi:hypothetical protein
VEKRKECRGMRVVVVLIASLVASTAVLGDEGGFIPWGEFKSLYRDSVEREILKRVIEEAPPRKVPQVYSIDEARYKMDVGSENAQGEVLLSGRVVSGEPLAIPLLGKEAVLTGMERVTGGTILLGKDDDRISFLPDGESREFQLTASFLVRSKEDNRSRIISFGIPHALRNSLELKLPPDSRLMEAPGIADVDGIYHFSASPSLSVKYLDKQGLAAATVVEIDALSRISVQKNRILIATSFLPIRSMPVSLILQLPEGAKYVSSSLKASWIKMLDHDRYELNVPPSEKAHFSIEFAMEGLTDDGEVSCSLPSIEGNTGQQGRFVIEEPDDGQVTVTAEGLVSNIPVERLGPIFAQDLEKSHSYMRVSVNEIINLTIRRFQHVSTPTTVLDCQYLFSSFEENGNILSVLVMDVPPEVGSRMRLKSVPDGEIWSLTVNGAKRRVYAGEQDTWIIPLESGQVSHVELAFLRKGPKLGLQGRIEAIVPESGLPSQDVRVGVALPARVELLSIEGPVSAAQGEDWKLPTEFVGKPHFFSRSFYKGEGMRLAISYKEPVNQVQ